MRLRISVLLLNLLAVFLFGVGCNTGEPRRILVVHSYEQGYQGYPEFDRLIEKRFLKNHVRPDIRTLYLDCEVYAVNEELLQMRLLLDSVSKDGWLPEVILVNEDQATYSLLASDHELVKRTPIVFGGVNYPNRKVLSRYPNVTGFHDRIELIPNIDLIKDLFGDTDLFTLLDYTYIDRQTRSSINQQIEGHDICVDTLSNDVVEFMRSKRSVGCTNFFVVGTRKQTVLITVGALRRVEKGQSYIQLKRDFTTVNVGNLSNKPSFTAINEAFGFGEQLLGGYMTTLPTQVEEEVDAAVRILHGAHPSEMPIVESRKEYILDWNVMKLWNIPYSKVASKYQVINITIGERYPLFWYSLISLLIVGVTGLIVRLFMLYRREERRKRAALEALSSEKQNLALAVEGSNTYVWKYEKGFFHIEKSFWDSQGVSIHDLSTDEMIGFIHPDSINRVKWGSDGVQSKRIEQTLCDFNGRGYQWWEFRYTTLPLDDGEVKMAGLLLNIQHVKDRERELEEAKLLAEKAEQKHAFLDNMSHEIRTPLNSIVGFSNLLASDEEIDPEEKQIYIQTINRNNDLLLQLINDILEITRMESGAISFQEEELLLSTLIDNVYLIHRISVPDHLAFVKEEDPAPLLVQADALRLTQVIANFLSNAIKFTPTGYIKLGYRYLPDTRHVMIFVEDTGQGIPLEEQKMVFKRFYKQDGFTQGTGLGLSISQIIAERLGAEISLWSEPGVGSRFMITLPCRLESIENNL